MNDQTVIENKKGFLQNDKLLVCSMLSFYSLCIIGLIAGAFALLGKQQETTKVNATATGAAIATQQANATATAVAHATELAQYDVIDQFNDNNNRWSKGFIDSEYWKGSRSIEDGIYSWNVETVKETFISWTNFSPASRIKDFDVYVDTKILDAQPGEACNGIIFRKITGVDDTHDYYYFALCNNSLVKVDFHGAQEGWERIATISSYTFPNDWNRLEITARGSHFTFRINGILVYEMNDDRLDLGGLALAVELKEKVPARFLFDNFGYQHR